MMRQSRATRTQARVLTWILAIVVVLFPGTSYQKRYNCRMTGARDLVACCCTGKSDCAPEVSSCDLGGCCLSEEKEVARDCGCCDITLVRVGSELAAAPQTLDTGGPVLPLALPPVHEKSPVLLASPAGCKLDKVPRRWTGPPVYLLYRSLLI